MGSFSLSRYGGRECEEVKMRSGLGGKLRKESGDPPYGLAEYRAANVFSSVVVLFNLIMKATLISSSYICTSLSTVDDGARQALSIHVQFARNAWVK